MTNSNPATDSIVGTLGAVDGKGTVRTSGRYDTDIEDLWSALTEPQRLAQWIAKVDGELRLGGEFEAIFTSGWEGHCRVDVCEPPRLLHVTTSPGQEDQTVMAAELVADGNQTILVLEERGLDLHELAAHGAGWQAHAEDLASHIARGEHNDWRTRWMELTPVYQAMSVHST
jgi:uncharacterized protein YndB with AHSA1/START domain